MTDFIDNADSGPVEVARELRERDVQDACVKHARRRGYWARKFKSPANTSVPDFLFGARFARGSFQWAEEFKAPKKKPTDLQEEEQRLMREAGWTVYPDTGTNGHPDIEAFKQRLRNLEARFGPVIRPRPKC